MTDLTKEDIKAIFKEVVSEERKAFWVDAETHWMDHAFVASVRKSGEVIKKTTLRVTVGAVITGAIGWVYFHLKN